uniref:Uncharacterized protein n=1 Tax=Cucumis sativus TaxID=3659 RepID=A0A0A0LI07_CUCSA
MLTALSLPRSWTIDCVVRPVHLPHRRLLFCPLTASRPLSHPVVRFPIAASPTPKDLHF